MPIFEYACRDCGHEFERLLRGRERPSCPSCESRRLARRPSVFASVTNAGSRPAPPTAACGTCGDPRGPGACADD